MPLFGKKGKIEFDAENPPQEIIDNPQGFSYIHNFKVHFKTSRIQAIATKMDVSVNSSSPEIPDNDQVTAQFNNRMAMLMNNPRMNLRLASSHITMIEYKETIAMPIRAGQRSSVTVPVQANAPSNSEFIFCRNCGNKLPADSKFCNKCGQSVA